MDDAELNLKVDVANAYGTADRGACIRGTQKRSPNVLPWAKWSFAQPARLLLGGEVISCETGVQQGDPFAPVMFFFGVHDVVEKIAERTGIRQIWFQDDSIYSGRASEVAEAFVELKEELVLRGMRVNQAKCEIYTKRPDLPLPHQLAGITVVADPDKWCYLGAPLRERHGSYASALGQTDGWDYGAHHQAPFASPAAAAGDNWGVSSGVPPSGHVPNTVLC